MKVVQLNAVSRGSTGNIMLNIAETVRRSGGAAYTFSESRPNRTVPANHRVFGNYVENLFHRGISAVTGISGYGSYFGTKQLLRQLDELSPDILHLHNLHGWYINIPMLFDYIRKKKIKTVWTLHDCWAFTAQCSHFTIEKCEKWKIGCYACPRYRLYPGTWVDRTRRMYKLKKKWFAGLDDLTIVTPSAWLEDLVKQSFLKDYPVRVINNGIDLSIFKPTPSDFREKHQLQNKKIVLGVASVWTDRKGLDVFVELSRRLEPATYQIVLVGTDSAVDKQLPESILSIHRTQNPRELAEIYTAADVFVNPTREENYPTVNMEAIACGTPVVTFQTGGSAEMIDATCGISVTCGNIADMTCAIQQVVPSNHLTSENCFNCAVRYDMGQKFSQYCELYETILGQSQVKL